ncbi:MAG: tRNA (cytidine(34)-2'-O)-methyltransferase [Actinobacteria bacterium]|nr:tRNA (cytidine(34)-2'-O)-methyltransferase [Actinomycetota bacterium]
MFHIVLYQPEIAPNTGACMRLAANTGATLHLIEPLGFELDDAKLRRAGMDYRDRAVVQVHPNLEMWRAQHEGALYAFSNHGAIVYTEIAFEPGDALLFGPESVGLPDSVMSADFVTAPLRIPMQPGVRSLNVANAAAVATYEAWRQNGFANI